MNSQKITHGCAVNFARTGTIDPDATAVLSGQHGRRNVQPQAGLQIVRTPTAEQTILSPASLPASASGLHECTVDAAPEPFASYVPFRIPCLRVNYESKSLVPLEQWVEAPPFPLEQEQQLETDLWWRDQATAAHTLDDVRKLLEERRVLEAQGGEFEFKPLLTTLKNMQIFIAHIRAGKQFRSKLTLEEAAAMKRLAKATAELVRAEKAPYKRTLRLALSLMILDELITKRQVLDPLRKALSTRTNRIQTAHLLLRTTDRSQLLAALPFRERPDGQNGRPAIEVLMFNSTVEKVLLKTVDDPSLLMYPSFYPLTVADFCRFSHLPVYPLGLTTNHVQIADSLLMSPLAFLVHDMDHMDVLRDVSDLDDQATTAAEAVFRDCDKRLHWRHMLLDQRLTRLPDLVTPPALELLSFQLVHENNPGQSAQQISASPSPFFCCLQELTKNRRERRLGYEAIYRNITDSQAAMTALWGVRLWECWQAADFQPLNPAQLETCAQQFTQTHAPQLEKHLAFLAQHRGTLRWLFVETANIHCLNRNNWHICSTSYKSEPKEVTLKLFRSYDENSGLCNLDNTDLAYFLVLGDPQWRDRIKEQTGACVPEVTWCAADTPEPMEI